MISFNHIFDFILPRFCPACNTKLPPDKKFICRSCRDSFVNPSTEFVQSEFEKKFAEEKIISGFFPLFLFQKDAPLQSAIHAFKYQKRFLLAVEFGQMLGERFGKQSSNWKIDLIIPVPLHSLKKVERGFNQSFYIAKGLSRSLKIPLLHGALKRNRFTESQTTKTLVERKENMAEAFIVKNEKKIEGKTILLLDDVITTGATIGECGKILLAHGAKAVYAASLAIAE